MKLKTLLSMLLMAALLLSPAAMMEEAAPAAGGQSGEPVLLEAVDQAVYEQTVDLGDVSAPGDEAAEAAEMDEAEEDDVRLYAPAGSVSIDEAFPDPIFREAVRAHDADSDGYLSESEMAGVTRLSITNPDVRDLTGVRLFSNLEWLSCDTSLLTAVDVSGLTNLHYLNVNRGELTSLKLDGCVSLAILLCGDNKLTTLDLSSFTALEDVACFSNQLTTLNVAGLANLTELRCPSNKLASLDLSGCTNLHTIECQSNQLSSLNVSGCAYLNNLFCRDNQLSKLDISGCTSLWALECYGNALTALDISATPLVKCVDINVVTPDYIGDIVTYRHPEEYLRLVCDCDVAITGGNPAAPVSKTPATDPDPVTDPTPVTEPDPVTDPTPVTDPDPAVDPDPVIDPPDTIPVIYLIGNNAKTAVTASPGDTYQLDLEGATGKKFKSNNKKVATVDSEGIVTIKGAGKAKITFKVGRKSRSVTIKVTDITLPTSVGLVAETTAVKKGDTVTLTPTVPDGTNPGGYKWKSSNKKIATVKNGVVKFKKKGKVTITVATKRGNKKAKLVFRVSNP